MSTFSLHKEMLEGMLEGLTPETKEEMIKGNLKMTEEDKYLLSLLAKMQADLEPMLKALEEARDRVSNECQGFPVLKVAIAVFSILLGRDDVIKRLDDPE